MKYSLTFKAHFTVPSFVFVFPQERLGLEMEREAERAKLIQNLCYACFSKFRIDSNARQQQAFLSRIPGDGKEVFNIPKRENPLMKVNDMIKKGLIE